MNNVRTEPIRTIKELEDVDLFLKDLGKELIMPPGSISRIIWHSLKNWLVEINESTMGWLMEKGELDFRKEWESSTELNNQIISRATAKAKLHDGNELLNGQIARMAVDLLAASSKNHPERTFRIIDIGAGTGATTRAILDGMNNHPHLADHCQFYLVELSAKRVPMIANSLDSHPINVNYQIAVGSESDQFGLLKDGVFDMTVSGAVFHHKNFPDYLDSINHKLKDDGMLVFGDWHMSICQHPAFIARLIEKLLRETALKNTVGSFKAEFGLTSEDEIDDIWKRLEPEERAANMIFMEYIHAIGSELSKTQNPPPMYFLESLETLDMKQKTLDEHGFITDYDDLKRHRPQFKKLSTGSNVIGIYQKAPNMTCAISVAKKIRGGYKELRRRSWTPVPTNEHLIRKQIHHSRHNS